VLPQPAASQEGTEAIALVPHRWGATPCWEHRVLRHLGPPFLHRLGVATSAAVDKLRHTDVALCCHLLPSVRTHGHPRHVVAAKSSTSLLTHYRDKAEDARHLLDDRHVSRRSCRCPRTASPTFIHLARDMPDVLSIR
jgi:hypothetical protein